MTDQTPNDTHTDQPPATDATTATPPNQGDTAKVVFTPEQQAAINKLIGEARREGKHAAEADIEAARKAAADEAERNRQIEAGEFDKVRQSLEAERDQFRTRAEQLDSLIAAIKPDVDAQWAALPEEVTELYDGDGEDVLAKRTHIAKHKKLIDRLTEKQDAARSAAGHGRTPVPNGTKPKEFTPVAPVRF